VDVLSVLDYELITPLPLPVVIWRAILHRIGVCVAAAKGNAARTSDLPGDVVTPRRHEIESDRRKKADPETPALLGVHRE
jgi:hypothetical protein